MIQANELRIGNWIEWRNPNFDLKECVCVDVDDFKFIIEKNVGHHYSPIPLTPEILEKAGLHLEREVTEKHHQFDFETKTIYYSDWDWIEESGGFEVRFISNTKDNNVAINTKYKSNVIYLHQLQNLYFALTGEELPIEL